MRKLLAAALACVVMSGVPCAVAQEDRHSENAMWLQNVRPVLSFYLDFFEPLSDASFAVTAYLNGTMNEEDARRRLESARGTVKIIAENIAWSADLLPPAPTGGSAESAKIIIAVGNFAGRARDVAESSENVLDLYSSFLDGNWMGYEAGVRQLLSTIEQVSILIAPFHETRLIEYARSDRLNRSVIESVLYDDVTYFAVWQLIYGSVLDDTDLLATQIERAVAAVRRCEAALTESKRELLAYERQHKGTYRAQIVSSEVKSAMEQAAQQERKIAAYHKLIVALSVKAPSPEMVEAALLELDDAFNAQLPPWKQTRQRLRSNEQTQPQKDPDNLRQSDAGVSL